MVEKGRVLPAEVSVQTFSPKTGGGEGRNSHSRDLPKAVTSPLPNCHTLPHNQTICEDLMGGGGVIQDKVAPDPGQDPSTFWSVL